MSTELAIQPGDLAGALKAIQSGDLGTLTLRREQLKQQIRELRPSLQYNYAKPAVLTEEQRQAKIQFTQTQIRAVETRLHVRAGLHEKLDAFVATLTDDERKQFEEITRYYRRGQQDEYDQNQIRNHQQELARLGEPEPEWVDPRVLAAQQLATLEAALESVNSAIKAAKKEAAK